MTPALIRRLTVDPTLDWLAGVSIPSGRGARRLVLAIGAQESGFTSRVQAPVAHAKGFWQFEAGGGVRGVLSHPNTQKEALAACAALVVPATVNGIWMALEHNDALACVFARLLLWSDPQALPFEEEPAWQAYLRCWRPGKPDRARWTAAWSAAGEAMKDGASV